MIVSSQTGFKRKHKSTFSSDGKDTDSAPPSAKRQQILPTSYQRNDMVTSSYSSSSSVHHVNETNSSNQHEIPGCEAAINKDCLLYNSKSLKEKTQPHSKATSSGVDLQSPNISDDKSSHTASNYSSKGKLLQQSCSPSRTSKSSSSSISQTICSPTMRKTSKKSRPSNDRKTGTPFTDSGNDHNFSEPLLHSNVSEHCELQEVSSIHNLTSAAQYINCMTPGTEPDSSRHCPLPSLAWANAQDVWQFMCKKDEEATCMRDVSMLDKHPGLQPRMRAILLDWLIEVCEVYKLHRETYYLAVDYLDRYLSVQEKVQKTHLQLIGITCLFVAAKVEEIYPPKIGEFAYVTDGACQEVDILQHEILLLQALDWNISPVTPMGWLGVYMQLQVNNRTPKMFNQIAYSLELQNDYACKVNNKSQKESVSDDLVADEGFIYPQFSGWKFSQTAKLLDLCSLDLGFANFSYSVIAAAAMCYTFNKDVGLSCSGLDWFSIEECVRWMEPFFNVIFEESSQTHVMEQNDQINPKYGLGHVCPNIVTDDSHIIQTHAITMSLFEQAEQYHSSNSHKLLHKESSPGTGITKYPEGLLTPPASNRKTLNPNDEEDESHQNVLKIRVITTPLPKQ